MTEGSRFPLLTGSLAEFRPEQCASEDELREGLSRMDEESCGAFIHLHNVLVRLIVRATDDRFVILDERLSEKVQNFNVEVIVLEQTAVSIRMEREWKSRERLWLAKPQSETLEDACSGIETWLFPDKESDPLAVALFLLLRSLYAVVDPKNGDLLYAVKRLGADLSETEALDEVMRMAISSLAPDDIEADFD